MDYLPYPLLQFMAHLWLRPFFQQMVNNVILKIIFHFRWLLALSSLPSLAFVIAASTWLPESARFNAASGHSDAALETLERIANDNGKPMLLGRLIVDDNIHLLSR